MIDYAVIAIYLVSVLIVGFYYSLRIKTVSEYAIAGKNYPTAIIVATIFATLIGGASTIGVAEQFFSVGIIFYVVCIGTVLRDLITAQWIIPRMGDLSGLISSGDLMARYYGKSGQVITGIVSLTRCIGIIGTQISALGFIGYYFFDIPYLISVIGSWGIVVLYSSVAGMRSVTITDVIQFGVLLVAIPMICNFGASAVGGPEVLWSALPISHTTFFVDPLVMAKYFGLAFVFMLPDLDPAILQRILMGRNLEQGRLSLLISAFASIPLYALAGLIGLVTLAMKPDLEPNMALPFLLNTVLPEGIKGIAICGILAVVMSTADSYLNIGGIGLVHDVIRPLNKKGMSEKNELRLMQFGTLVLGVMAAICALAVPNIFKLAVISFALWKPLIFPPMIMGILGFIKGKDYFHIGIIVSLSSLFIWNIFFKPHFGVDGILVASMLHFSVLLLPYLLESVSFLQGKRVAR